MQPEIQRFDWFDTVDVFESEREVIWKYKRAIEGHKFILVEIDFMVERSDATYELIGQIYNGHVYSHWGSFPNIFDQSTLAIASLIQYSLNVTKSLHNWECKEFTMSMRNTSVVNANRFCFIVWFYEIPMSKADTFEYATKQPRYKFRHGGPTTLDRFEEGI